MAVNLLESKALSLDDWLNLPEGPPMYELETGRLIKEASPTRRHQDINGILFYVLRQYCREHNFGTMVLEVDVALSTGHGYIPDLSFVRKERESELLGDDGKVHGAPDMVVEIISPGTEMRDRHVKFQNYWEAGVEWYWLIDSQTLLIQEFQHTPEGYLCRATVASGEVFRPHLFSGLKIDLKELLDGDTKTRS